MTQEKTGLHIAHISINEFQDILLAWSSQHGRHNLPWQKNPTPYSVLVSEIMLQQTQVATVIPYFERWITKLPTVQALADAHEDEVMALWQGLGYYSRARNLHKAAKFIVEYDGGEFPDDLAKLEEIPGVGRYTAGAIRSFAYNQYGPIVDGNVRRLFCRLFTIEGLPNSTPVNKLLWQLAEHYTPDSDSTVSNRAFAQALLDMGATLCTPKSPSCQRCPFSALCTAYQQNRIEEFPTPKPKKRIPVKQTEFSWQISNQKIFLVKRPAKGIWGGLWCLPEFDASQVREKESIIGQFRHTFTHYKLEAQVIQIASEEQGQWFELSQLDDIGLPQPIKKFILQYRNT